METQTVTEEWFPLGASAPFTRALYEGWLLTGFGNTADRATLPGYEVQTHGRDDSSDQQPLAGRGDRNHVHRSGFQQGKGAPTLSDSGQVIAHEQRT